MGETVTIPDLQLAGWPSATLILTASRLQQAATEEEVPEKAEEAWPPLDPMSPLKEARMRRFVFFEDDELDEQGSGYDSSGEYF